MNSSIVNAESDLPPAKGDYQQSLETLLQQRL